MFAEIIQIDNIITAFLTAIIVLGLLYLHKSYNSLRSRHKRALIKQFKADIDNQYVKLDQGFKNLEQDMQKALDQKVYDLRLETTIPSSVKQAAQQNTSTSNFSSIVSQPSSPNT